MEILAEKKLLREFGTDEPIVREKLIEFFLKENPDLNSHTLISRIQRLLKTGVLRSVMRGKYLLTSKQIYQPAFSASTTRLFRRVQRAYPHLDLVVTELSWLNEFLRHQLASEVIVLEVERDFTESVFHFLRDQIRLVYFDPDARQMAHYLSGRKKVVVVKPLVSRAPAFRLKVGRSEIRGTSLEKLLVDVFCDAVFFRSYVSESETSFVFNSAFERYVVNFSSLLAYARRRGREEDMRGYLSKQFSHYFNHILE